MLVKKEVRKGGVSNELKVNLLGNWRLVSLEKLRISATRMSESFPGGSGIRGIYTYLTSEKY